MANILIIDDDTPNATALARILKHEGHQAVAVEGAGEALSRLRQQEPDLILLDLEMPRVNGLALLDALGSEPRFAHLRVAIYSGRTDPEALAEARRLGACDYIVKGHDWEETYARILKCLAEGSPAGGRGTPAAAALADVPPPSADEAIHPEGFQAHL